MRKIVKVMRKIVKMAFFRKCAGHRAQKICPPKSLKMGVLAYFMGFLAYFMGFYVVSNTSGHFYSIKCALLYNKVKNSTNIINNRKKRPKSVH